MTIDVQFESTDTEFDCDFGEVTNISDGGYERGLVEGEKVGYEKGSAEGYAKGEADGRSAEWNSLWDAIQKNGNRTNYEIAFSGSQGWTSQSFKPKYDIKPTNARNIFANAFDTETEPVDLTELLSKANVSLDTSNTKDAFSMFQGARNIKRIPVLDLRLAEYGSGGYNLHSTFRNCAVETIDGLIVREDGGTHFDLTFTSCDKLREITFIEGVIGFGINLQYSPLSKQTIIRIINALSKDTTGKACDFSKWRVNKEFETEEGKLDGTTTSEWLDLIATKPNWTISLK